MKVKRSKIQKQHENQSSNRFESFEYKITIELLSGAVSDRRELRQKLQKAFIEVSPL